MKSGTISASGEGRWLLFSEHKVSVTQDEEVLEIGSTTLCLELTVPY